MKIGIYGGSFDPIHNGHVNLARYVLHHADLDKVWLMVSPLNPLKPQGYVATDAERLAMARLAVSDIQGVEASDFEFSLPIPSYTYATLCRLRDAYPEHDFRLIIGGDNWASFPRWRNPDEIISEFGVIVYPRPDEDIPAAPAGVEILRGAPLMDISSSRIREELKTEVPRPPEGGDSVVGTPLSGDWEVPPAVLDYIRYHHIYAP